jgi:hypothetical protein
MKNLKMMIEVVDLLIEDMDGYHQQVVEMMVEETTMEEEMTMLDHNNQL